MRLRSVRSVGASFLPRNCEIIPLHLTHLRAQGWPSKFSHFGSFTVVFRQVPEGYIGFVEELPGANTQGATLDEARANVQEAVAMILDANRELAQQSTGQGP